MCLVFFHISYFSHLPGRSNLGKRGVMIVAIVNRLSRTQALGYAHERFIYTQLASEYDDVTGYLG